MFFKYYTNAPSLITPKTYRGSEHFWTQLNISIAQPERTAQKTREDEDITCAHQEVEVQIGDLRVPSNPHLVQYNELNF
jgi:hypothetical protein